jgi:hypothetical protein
MGDVVSLASRNPDHRLVWIEPAEGKVWRVRSTRGHDFDSVSALGQIGRDPDVWNAESHKVAAAVLAARLREDIKGRARPGTPFANIIDMPTEKVIDLLATDGRGGSHE